MNKKKLKIKEKTHHCKINKFCRFAQNLKGGQVGIAQLISICQSCRCNGCVIFEFNDK